MAGPSMSGSSEATATTATCTRGNNGAPGPGSMCNNTPNMVMAGPGTGMNMNGADASAAAGLNTTTANWHYTGPALPSAEAQQLLAQGENGPTDIHMAQERMYDGAHLLRTDQRGTSTSRAPVRPWRRYTSPSAALAAGYVPVSPTNYPVVYYVNPAIVAANAAAGRTLDPQSVDGLVFAQTPSGQEVLAAAMYLLPSTVTPSMPYGALVQWHQRTDVCGPSSEPASNPLQITGVRTLPRWERPAVHALHDHGVAGTGCGGSTGHSTAGHPDRRGGGHVDGNVRNSAESWSLSGSPHGGRVWPPEPPGSTKWVAPILRAVVITTCRSSDPRHEGGVR